MRYYDEAKTHKTEVYDDKWGYSSAGRAPALQAGGQEFESPYLHHVVRSGRKPETKTTLHLENHIM